MADKRKLQAEIDRCLKKVTEGVETFDDIWGKVHSAANANQKEKYEADLKKEIKKLQRLRDQIKTWIQSSEIKDKSPLKEHRKLIETQMEKFKVVERETKTKAYSKEGLGAAAKVDPVQKEREDVRQWLTECIDKLSQEVEQFDAEVESLYAGSKKRKLDRDKADRVEELQDWLERHKYHIRHLEAILRKLDNCTMEPDEIKEIQEDVNYYIDCSQEPDFTENELIYDDLNIDDSTPATQGLAQLTQNDDEVFSGTPSSPPTSSMIVGPLSPATGGGGVKTVTPLKSTSQELFEERRRGKTLSQSEPTIIPEVPPSPRRTPAKSHSVSSNSTMMMPVTTATTVPLTLTATVATTTTNNNTTPSRTVPSKQPTPSTTPSKGISSAVVLSPTATTSSPLTLSNSRTSSQPSTNGSTSRVVVAQLPKAVQPPSGPAYSVAAGGHHNNNNSTQVPASMSPPAQQTHTSSSSSSSSNNSMINHIGGLLSPSSEVTAVSSGQVMAPGSPLQNGPINLMSPLSKQQQQMSGLLSMASSLSIQKPPINVFDQPQHIPNTTSSLSQSSTNSSFLDEAIFSAPSSSGNSLPQPAHLTVDTQFQQEQQQQQQMSAPSSAASGNSLSSATSNSTSGGGNNNTNSSPVSTPMPSTSATAMGLSSNLLMNDTSLMQPINMSLRPTTTSNSTAAMMGAHSLNMLLNTNTFNPQNAFTSTAMLQSSVASGASKLSSSEQLGSVGTNSSDLLTDPSGNVLSPSNSVSSLTSTGLSSTLSSEAKEATTQLSSLKAIAEQAVVQANLFPSAKKLQEDDTLRSLVSMESTLPVRRTLDSAMPSRTDAHLQPLLGVSPLGPVMLSKENIAQAHMLETVFRHLPQPADSEKVRPYLQRNPHPSPPYHHQHPPSNFDTFDLYQRLSIETLFFIFYYMEGTKAQYLAAKALKKQSWRFHTKYMMWFQRHEEPKAITDEYEMGTYIYFDFEKWQQRKKEGFTFEYKFLEDKDLP